MSHTPVRSRRLRSVLTGGAVPLLLLTGLPAQAHAQEAAVHTVRPGDTLTRISAARGVSVADLLRFNGLGLETVLYPGDELRLTGAAAPAPAAGTYTVQPNDGWWVIARRTGVSAAELQRLNGMTASTVLHPGMVLITAATAPASPPAPAPAPGTYTVREGDGWWIIAHRTGVTMETLQRLNGMTATTVLHPGMVLRTGQTASAPAPSPATYVVQANDGWWLIAQRTGVSMERLQRLNGMTVSTMLHPGMVLKTTSVSTSSAPAPAPAPASKQAAVDYVRSAVRNPSSYYVWGGNGPSGFDCSGLTQQAMAQAGISIPRRAGDQYLAAKSYVPISQAQPGDLVFYANQSTGRIYHTAMYMGGGQLAHALNEDAGLVFTSTTIMKSDMLAVAARY